MKSKIEYVSIDTLIPYARNARTHSDAQVAQIAASITEFGWTNPILTDGVKGVIAGHGRLLAARKLGHNEVPIIELSHLTDIQKRAYIIADNKLSLNAGWDDEVLSVEMEELDDEGFDLTLTGFGDEELEGLLEKENTGLTDDDAVPEVPDNPVSKLGDIWELGNHRVMCGDSTSIDTVDLLMNGQKADMVHTDPPYGISYQSNRRTKTDKFDILANDDVFLDIAPVIESSSKGWVFVWTSWKVITTWINMFEGFGYPTNQVIWFKGGGGIGDLKKTFISDYETALVWNRGTELTGKRIGSVWKVVKDGASTYMHPTQKPVALPEEAIDKTTRQGDLVLDLFGGSGSTLIACEKTGRVSYNMELDPKYVDVIINRWQDFTGKEATLDGVTFKEVENERTNS
jgi:DNA modification methylase|tara:strand:+ start:67 stop:1269 length:1203 start_codon:yes stop_codon:yes gene_type:complete